MKILHCHVPHEVGRSEKPFLEGSGRYWSVGMNHFLLFGFPHRGLIYLRITPEELRINSMEFIVP